MKTTLPIIDRPSSSADRTVGCKHVDPVDPAKLLTHDNARFRDMVTGTPRATGAPALNYCPALQQTTGRLRPTPRTIPLTIATPPPPLVRRASAVAGLASRDHYDRIEHGGLPVKPR